MSVRARAAGPKTTAEALQKELKELKEAATEQPAAPADAAAADAMVAKAQFDQLSPTEQSAASLGVSPDAFKPISFMNNAHYNTLIKQNAIDDELARRIEAYRAVAASSS